MNPTNQIFLSSSKESFFDEAEKATGESSHVEIVGRSGYVSGSVWSGVVEAVENGAVLLVDLDTDTMGSLRTLQEVRRRAPEAKILMATSERRFDSIIPFVRAGASDFIQMPLEAAAIRDALVRLGSGLEAQPGGRDRRGRVTAFVGAKGGCGTTTLAVNLAVALAEPDRSVVLVDLDMPGGDASAMLRLDPAYTLADVAENIHRLDMSLLTSMMSLHASGVHTVASAGEGSSPRWVGPEQVSAIIEFLKENFDEVVVGCGGLGKSDMAALEQAHIVHLVTTLDFVALKRAQGVMSRLQEFSVSEDSIRLVVNRVDRASELNPGDAKGTLGIPVAWEVPLDSRTVEHSVNTGEPFVLQGRSRIKSSFARYIGQLTGTKEEKTQGSLLRRLVPGRAGASS